MHPYLEAARERVVVYDGATGTNLQARDLSADDFGGPALEGCNEVLVDTRPDVVADLHRSFFDVGSDVVETDTFGAFSVVLAEYGIADRAHELNVKAAQIAKDVASGYGGWVAGSMGPGTKLPSLGQIRFADLRDAYEVQARGLLEGGVDLLLIETCYDLLQAKAAMIDCRRAMAAVEREVPLQVQVTMEATGRMLVGTEIGAAYTAVPFHQDTSFLVIGERTNANGSKKFREAMLVSDWDTCLAMAREQVKEGAHVLDVCVDYVGRDGAVDMDEVASRFATQVSAPLVMDSTESPVMEAGLQWIGGRAILNSANLEDGEGEGTRFDRVCTLAKEYGAAVICLLIDDEGQARDVEWKLRVAHRIHDLAVNRYGLSPSDPTFDARTSPLSTGAEDLRGDG